MTPYVSFLLDLAGGRTDGEGDDVRIVDGTIRFAPSAKPRPKNAFIWKVSVNTSGLVTVRGFEGGYKVLAIATWDGEKLIDHQQRLMVVPTFYQWNLVRASVRRAMEMASTAKAPPTEAEQDDDPSSSDRRAMKPTPPELFADAPVPASARRAFGERTPEDRVRRNLLLAIGGFVLLLIVITAVMCTSRYEPPTAPPSAPVVATPAPANPTAPIATQEPVVSVDAAVPTIETVDTFAAALALAKPAFTPTSTEEVSPGAAALARYRKLQWSDVSGANETTLPLMAKDAEAETGKRICVEGSINRIQRRDIVQPGEPPRRVYTGGLRVDGEDDVWFVVTGSTGELVRRSRAKLCGIVTGASMGVPAVFGMFDLPENAQPIVER